ncbi:hypothetical protein V501_02733, partial [Pseudogymnoascus sp. VKM F-4519 (FW-2642)]
MWGKAVPGLAHVFCHGSRADPTVLAREHIWVKARRVPDTESGTRGGIRHNTDIAACIAHVTTSDPSNEVTTLSDFQTFKGDQIIVFVQDTDYITSAVKGHCERTVRLDFFGNIDRRPPRQYFPEQTMSANDAAQVQPMQQMDDDAEQAVSGQTDQAQRFVLEDLKTGEDAHLVIVSTAADGYPITAKKITTEARASKWLGQMSDQSLQTLSRNKVAISSTSTNSATNGEPEKVDEEFLKHGPG